MPNVARLALCNLVLFVAVLLILVQVNIRKTPFFNLTSDYLQFQPMKPPWHADKFWHSANEFPLCTMDACFNFSRCAGMTDFLIYLYGPPLSEPFWYLKALAASPSVTADPTKACLFLLVEPLELVGFAFWPRAQLQDLPYWNGGLNHVIASLSDKFSLTAPSPHTIGNASVIATCLLETTYRPGFDISIPLPGRNHFTHLQSLKPWRRRYLLTFKGTRYLGQSEGNLRSDPLFRGMHNGKDIIIAVSCKHSTNDKIRRLTPKYEQFCDEDEAMYRAYGYGDLMNSTFGLVAAGRSSSTYRLIETLSAGTIPVLIADNYVKPFDTMIQWHQCLPQFPTSEMARILSAVRSMGKREMERRQRYCLFIYREYLKDDAILARSVVRALKLRFYGVFPQFNESIPTTVTSAAR